MFNSFFFCRDKFIEIEDFLQTLNPTNSSVDNAGATRNATLDLELKSMKNIVCETEERCDKLEALVQKMDHSLVHTMQLVSDMENHLATQQRLSSYINSRGK